MATVTGNLEDFSLSNLTPFSPSLVFIPSRPAITTTNHLLVSKEIAATVTPTGSFTVDLTPTADIRPDTFYGLRMEWLDSVGGFVQKDFPDFQLRVPPEGGVLNDLLGDLSNFLDVWVDETDNPTFAFWYQPSTGLLWK